MKIGTALAITFFGILGVGVIYQKRNKIVDTEQLTNNNIQAFLAALRAGEGTSGSNGYNLLYGGATFSNMSDHPYITGEWPGVKLTDAQCQGAGLSPGCITTAAGAYQFTHGTWEKLKLQAGLPDFSANSQDLAAIQELDNLGALDNINSGDITEALAQVNKTWASVPGSPYGQPTLSLSDWLNNYSNAGGALLV